MGLEYDEALRSVGVAVERWPDYRKWLRFYLHFCDKYGRQVTVPESLPAFVAKLAAPVPVRRAGPRPAAQQAPRGSLEALGTAVRRRGPSALPGSAAPWFLETALPGLPSIALKP